jgi:hypothetical protein
MSQPVKLGRSIELVLEGQQVLKLCRTVGATSLADLVDSVDTPVGRERLKAYLDSEPYPHFEAHPSRAGLLIRIEENGERTVGRFVNREFIPAVDRNALNAKSRGELEGRVKAVSESRTLKKTRAAHA